MSESSRLGPALDAAVSTALGRDHRDDPVLPRTGGPAGNALLTAWTGLVLLVLLFLEGLTLVDIHGLIDWHLALGVLLVPPALLKTATTTWRMLRYYAGDASYRAAGPPPMLLRVLGPLVVLTTVALLATGVALVLVGQTDSRRALVDVLGVRVDLLFLHQASFFVWFAAMTLHVLGRTLPAWQLARRSRPRVPGPGWRRMSLVVVGLAAFALAGWVLLNPGGWNHPRDEFGQSGGRDDGLAAAHLVP